MKKTVFITGSSSGIGRATALKFQHEGWNVVASMRSPGKESELTALANVICPALDVHDVESIRSALAAGIERFGKIDAVINNAGYGLIGPFETFSQEQIERQFQTNVFGLMNVTREILPHMRANFSGHIINIASFAGRSIFPLYSVYHASKWAVEGFVDSLSYEAGRFNIRLKLIEPGTIRTEFWGRSTDRVNATGIEAYDDYSKPILDAIDTAAASLSARAEDVAEAIWVAANDHSGRLRYVVGADAHITLLARKLLPDSLYQALIQATFHSGAVNHVGTLKSFLAGRASR
ncbi:MAG: SDR family oxidoreductase [Pedobacter sp.]|nr:SDR family oxidoreductase [Pedobacter sp.]